MPGIGQLRDRARFHRLDVTTDAIGGRTSGFSAAHYLEVWGALSVARGRDGQGGGRMQSEVDAVLTVRSTEASRAVATADKVVIDGVDYAIRSIANPDRRARWIEMQLRRGGAV